MVARVLFAVLTCGATRSHHHRATIKALLTSTQPLSPLRIIRPPVSLPGLARCLLVGLAPCVLYVLDKSALYKLWKVDYGFEANTPDIRRCLSEAKRSAYQSFAHTADYAVSKNNADYEIGLCAARASSIIHFNF